MLFSLVIQLLPPGSVNDVATAATANFTFPGESSSMDDPHIVTDQRVTLKGTFSNVDPSTISYSVYQIVDPSKADDKQPNQRVGLTSNIYIDGTGITIYNIQLFSGLNKIVFQGTKNGGTVSNAFFVEYRDSPMLYNLVASLDGGSFPIVENGTTVVESSGSRGKSTANISITGNAPNASSVTIVVNGSSKTYTVNSSNGSTFAASPVVLKQGQNSVTFKVNNGTQVITSTRNIAFYNGNVTFYDVNLNEYGSDAALVQSVDLSTAPEVSVKNGSAFTITGTVMVPNSYHANDTTTGVKTPHPPLATPVENSVLDSLKASIMNVTDNVNTPTVAITQKISGTPAKDASYFTYTYTISNLQINNAGATYNMAYDKKYALTLSATNEVNQYLGTTPTTETSSGLFFTLRDGAKPFVSQINYLSGFKGGTSYQTISGIALEGASIYGLPLAVEVLVGNPNSNSYASTVQVTGIKDLYGNNKDKNDIAAGGYYSQLDYGSVGGDATNDKMVTIDGVDYQRVILVFNKLPFEGTQTITIQINDQTTTAKTAKFTMLYGPFVKYKTVYDLMQINDDTTVLDDVRMPRLMKDTFGYFAGQLMNVNDTNEIRYVSKYTGDKEDQGPRTIYFYINNVPITVVPTNANGTVSGPVPDEHSTYFKIPDESLDEAYDALISGANTIKYIFQGTKSYYSKSITINLNPTNLPVIPANDSGVFPFTYSAGSTGFIVPILNDPNFPKSNSIYTTNESQMNVYGTFDFIDLGDSYDKVAQAMSYYEGMDDDDYHLDDYILKVTGTTLTADVQWDLGMPFQVVNGNTFIKNYPEAGTINSNLVVRYDISTQSFSFVLKKQDLSPDGSSSVYVFTVYNSGTGGAKATYRLEVDPTALPYKILKPYLPAQSIINQNFVEVVIDSAGADTVVINKVTADQTGFDYNNDGDITDDEDYPNAYRATVSGLKTGENKIAYTITNANDTVSGTLTVTYQPTNIPGAQYMEDMKNAHKVFDGTLSLTFPKGTSLIRKDYNLPVNLKNQVYTGHKLLFGIANPSDGVVDRREYDNVPADFDLILQNYGTRFRVSFPSRFGKSSPVYWIDGGMADNLSTATYDPIKTGVDPYQYPGNTSGPNGTSIPTYDERPADRELVASKRGSLTLSFDPNIVDSVGTLVTVYHYDVDNKYWVNLGGTVDNSKNTITVPFDDFGYYVVGKMSYSFSDVSNHSYARNFMEAIYSKGIMNASTIDDFGSDMYTTRGEFARMVIKALNIPLNYDLDNPSFDDVAPIINADALWDFGYIETAAKNGIIRGTQPKIFEPNNSLTRGEAAVILARALSMKLDTDATKIDKALQKAFKDYANISYYSRSAVVAIAKKGYIKGSPVDSNDLTKGYVFEAQSYLLRSDAAIIVGKVMADLKKLPKLN